MKTDLVVVGYIFADGKVLLIHHNKLDLWLGVGGHIDKDETPDDALKREIKEETNLDVDIIGQSNLPIIAPTKRNLAAPFYVNVHSVGDHDHCCFYYVCQTPNPEKLAINNELKNSRWFSKEELNEKIIPAYVRDQVLQAFGIINS